MAGRSSIKNSLKLLVRQRLGILRISQTEAERRGDLSRGFIGDILRDQKVAVHGANVGKLALALGVTAEDVIAASRGGSASTSSPSEAAHEVEISGSQAPVPGGIPEVEARIGAGARGFPIARYIRAHSGGTMETDAVRDWWRVPTDVIRGELRTKPSGIVIFRVSSDSMEPEIMRGDFAFIDTSRREVEPEGVWAIYDGFGLVLKRILPHHRGGNVVLVLRSANNKYPDDERAPEEITVIGRYVARFTVF